MFMCIYSIRCDLCFDIVISFAGGFSELTVNPISRVNFYLKSLLLLFIF